jgi:DNA-directed RNA polymerase subunit RPC12/RpoP
METQPLVCNNCGAPLQVHSTTNFVTCMHCRSQLAIKRTDSSAYTEVLEGISTHTGRMSEDLETIRLQNELERVDREWQLTREKYMVQGNSGPEVPTILSSVGGCVFAAILAGIFAYLTVASAVGRGLSYWVLIGGALVLLVLSLGFLGVFFGRRAVSRYTGAEQAYTAQRERLLSQINARQRQHEPQE